MPVRNKPRGVMEGINVLADASFAPTGSVSHGGNMTFVEGGSAGCQQDRLVPQPHG